MSNTTAGGIARILADAGIDRVFGLPGGEILILMEELRRAGIDFTLMRHESNAGVSAAVYGKLRRQPGVVLTTLGPGAANLMFTLSSAYLDQEPLLAISAQLPDSWPKTHTHQLLPLEEAYRPLTRFVAKITAENVTQVLPHALSECMRRPLGAAYLTLSAREAAAPMPANGPTPPWSARAVLGDTREKVREIGAALKTSQRPLVLVGLGTEARHAGRLRRWLQGWNLPVAVTPKVKGIVDETPDNFVGVIGGMAADGLMCEALRSADLLIGFGLDPVEVDKTWHAELPITWVLEAPNVGEMVPDGVSLINHEDFLGLIGEMPPPAKWETPFLSFQQRRHQMINRGPLPMDSSVMWPGDLVKTLASVVPPETIVTTDVGSHKYLFGQFWRSTRPETFWMSNGLSGMAYGLSAAIGAKLARPDVPVLAAVGDGGFSMNFQELETAKRIGAPFITVVLADRSYSLIKLAQEGRKLEPYRTDFDGIDSVKIAEACGIRGLRTSDTDQMAEAVREALDLNEHLVVEVPIACEDYRRLF